MWVFAVMILFEAIGLVALAHCWRRPEDAFLGGAVGRARWRKRLTVGAATAWAGVGLVAVGAYALLSARVRPGDEATIEQAHEEATVHARPAACLEVASDFERYPDWAEATSAEVLERDGGGRATLVRIGRTAPTGQAFVMTMGYEYGEEPLRLVSRVVAMDAPDAEAGEMAEAMRALSASMRGEYRFETDGSATKVSYDLTVALPPALPAFLAGRMASMMASRTLQSLCGRVESLEAGGEASPR